MDARTAAATATRFAQAHKRAAAEQERHAEVSAMVIETVADAHRMRDLSRRLRERAREDRETSSRERGG
jgi:hypothetical protein